MAFIAKSNQFQFEMISFEIHLIFRKKNIDFVSSQTVAMKKSIESM